ncbi:nicotinate-nucleotide--dimethylbenzimidazole phosphoribosyltransferase [Acetobacterium woodii]|uniref:Nicotinate-nucleotide--dimethylbenzimidazole phosphoribosyltransferase n=1 Tax=Acetobacterium woodii (strain ATCC 29683 / DSM 1030 / JCM 2381 / KCTC 1655 / WB1) TaxID=931626 RepID=H6LFV7_ACEWD|nr:nicotinate-nucleotide--dimethylbenzimidazole phosphoribosyltransferase [Acetobacterium woodii]AFA48245.1 nicotinate-nucleotide-dimethylbenzimidazole phosphoribosyltransferase CobT2 [Acetobacterium woodii DSM 1030]
MINTKYTLNQVIEATEPADPKWQQAARDHIEKLAIPPWSLGQLLVIGEQLSGIQRTIRPTVDKKMVITMAGDHGVVAEGVSAFPQEVTPQMVENFVKGGAGINILAKVAGAEVIVVDMGVAVDMPELVNNGAIIDCKIDYGTKNFYKEPAMTREQAIAALEAGINVAAKVIEEQGVNLLATGDMGIGNTTPSAAILAVMAEYPVSSVTGRGTGIDNTALLKKIKVIRESINYHQPDKSDPIDVLAKVGGFEIAGIAGVILGASYLKVPVLVDGFISTAGALIAKALCPQSLDYMIPSHQSEEPGHQLMWQALGLRPLLNLNFRLGEGTGAAVAMHLVESSARIMNDMLTFEDAGVTNGHERV